MTDDEAIESLRQACRDAIAGKPRPTPNLGLNLSEEDLKPLRDTAASIATNKLRETLNNEKTGREQVDGS